jgi:hypothetical protein
MVDFKAQWPGLNAANQTPSRASHTKAVVQMALATSPSPIAAIGKNLAIRLAVSLAIFDIA